MNRIEMNVRTGEVKLVALTPEEIADAQARTAAEAAARRVPEIHAARDAALLDGVSWNNKDWHIDQTFQDHLTGLVAAFAAGILPANAAVPIRTRGNTIETLTYTELKQLAGVVLGRVQQIWAESWAAKDALQ